MLSRILPTALGAALLLTLGCDSRSPDRNAPAAPPVVSPTPSDAPPQPANQRAVTMLPPGQSGFISSDGQAAGQAGGGAPGGYGAHLDDQREPYFASIWKDGSFQPPPGTPEEPVPGARIYRDDFGVPIIYGDSLFNMGFGSGYAIAQDRLFLMDAVRRMGRGTFAELTGCASVPGDIQQRTLTYSDAEYAAIFAGLSTEAQQLTDGYIAGANAWIAEVKANPQLLPVEYVLLGTGFTPQSSIIEDLTRQDVLASGVLITRTVASEGGREMQNVATLQDLMAQYNDVDVVKDIFRDFIWFDDREAAVTVPDADFSNITTAPADRDAVFGSMVDYALNLPLGLADGPGTGASPDPCLALPFSRPAIKAGALTGSGGLTTVEALERFRQELHGGSYMVAVAGSKTASGRPLLINGPQLGYSYPSLLHEIEVHGPGIDVRGSSVPALPVVGIGYTPDHVWGLTTGNSKTIDSFIETTRVNPAGGDRQYFHDGQWKDMECRDEVINYRQAQSGLPVGQASFSVTERVCRTVHGPVVASVGDQARSLKYAMFMREVDTIEAVLQWMSVDNFNDFDASMRLATWNENLMYADDDGNIAYYHPGLHIRRSPLTDQRLPSPGEGGHEPDGVLTFAELPQSINPAQGYLANWNNKPALGWGPGVAGDALSLPAGPHQRVVNWFELMEPAGGLNIEQMIALDREAGIVDPRARMFLPYLNELRVAGGLPPRETAALDILAQYDGLHMRRDMEQDYVCDDDGDSTTEAPNCPRDTAGATILDVFVKTLREQLFADELPANFMARLSAVGNHEYDVPAMDNAALRVLDPATSSIVMSRDYSGGLSRLEIVENALTGALDQLQTQFASDDPSTYLRVHHRQDICSLTGGITGPCITMPHQDRGSWNHIVEF